MWNRAIYRHPWRLIFSYKQHQIYIVILKHHWSFTFTRYLMCGVWKKFLSRNQEGTRQDQELQQEAAQPRGPDDTAKIERHFDDWPSKWGLFPIFSLGDLVRESLWNGLVVEKARDCDDLPRSNSWFVLFKSAFLSISTRSYRSTGGVVRALDASYSCT